MRKKILFAGAIVGALFMTASSSIAPTGAAPIHPSHGVAPAAAESDLIELVRRHRNRRIRHAGVGVFIVPGLYWGPAFWDPTYSKACWRNIRPCQGCARNWVYVC